MVKTTSTIGKVINILFHERLKTVCIAGYELMNCKEEPCAWNEIYGPRLKGLGVSEKTLSKVLKLWIKKGLIKKVKAPFPYRSKYKLIKPSWEFELLKDTMMSVFERSNEQNHILTDVTMSQGRLSDEDRLNKKIEASKKLRGLGREAIEEWESISKAVFYGFLELGLQSQRGSKELDDDESEVKIAFLSFFLIYYLLHSVAHLSGESRNEARKSLLEYRKSRLEKASIIDKTKLREEAITLKTALAR